MAQQNNAQTIALQLEKVRDKVPLLYERDDVLLTMIQQRGDVEKVSSRNMRLPLQLVPGGKAGSYSADGGDLGGSAPGHARLAINKVRKALGINQLGKLIAYTSVEQEHAWENLGITVSQIVKEGPGGRASDLDMLFSGKKTISGIPIKSSVNADQTRVDFLDLSHWGRAVMKDIDFFEVGGQTVFPIYGASGGVSASFIFYFDTGFQVWNDSPRSGSFIDTLARPNGY